MKRLIRDNWIKTSVALVMLGLMTTTQAKDRHEDPTIFVEAKLGVYQPEIDNWDTFYGSSYMPQFGLGVHYQPYRTLSVGVTASMAQDKGRGFAPLNSEDDGTLVTAGRARIKLFPITAEATWHGEFVSRQILIPHISVGWVRMGYRGEISGDDNIRVGKVDGTVWRVGFRYDLNHIDPGGARKSLIGYGINRTFLTLEYSDISADDRIGGVDVDLGGKSLSLGVAVGF